MRYPPKKQLMHTVKRSQSHTTQTHRGYSDIPDNLHKHQHTVKRTRRVTPEI